MNIMDVIKARRSIRKYQELPVEREKIMECLEAARLAPSACNAQPWKYIVVDDKNLKDRLAKEAFSGIYRVSRFAAKAPVLLAVVSDPDWLPKAGGAIRKTDFHLIDIGISGEHLVLKATELELGTCWIGWFDEPKAKRALKIASPKKIEVMLALGYPDENSSFNHHERKPLEQMSCFNGWEDS